MHPANSILRYAFFYALLSGVVLVTFFIFQPYLVTLTMATAFAVVCQPLYKGLLRILRGKASLAAIATILAVSILVLAPVSLIGAKVGQEAASLYERIGQSESFNADFLIMVENTIESYVQAYVPTFDLDLPAISRQTLGWITGYIGPVFSSTLQTILHFFLGVIAFFYLVKDGGRFVRVLVDLSPLKDKHDRDIFDRLIVAINSIIKGSLLIALVQGFVSGVGFAIFGVPSATLWGSLAAVGALVPGVGTAIVIAPVVIYLFVSGNTFSAIGLAIWGTLAVGTIDNFLGPILMGRGVRIHPLFILFAVIGGVQYFGPLGFILGPLVLSFLYALLDIHRVMTVENTSELKKTERKGEAVKTA